MNIAKNMIANGEYREDAELPREITIQTPSGKSLVLKKPWSSEVGNWKGEWHVSQDNLTVSADVRIRAVAMVGREYLEDDDEGTAEFGDKIGYYTVRVYGLIEDGNTDVNPSRSYSNPDSWERNFVNQGAETLDGAKAIAEANIRELYQEFIDYLNSERNYVTTSNGRSYARTTENANEWNYNFGDSYDDIYYLDWQNKEHGYPYQASTKKSKSVSKASPYTLDWCGDKLHDALECLHDCFMSNYTSSHHSFFNSVLSEYGVNSQTILHALRHLIGKLKVRSISEVPSTDYMASTRKSIKSDVEQFSAVVKSIRDRR